MWIGVLLVGAFASVGVAVPPGWRMVDRYAGFRFECYGRFDREAFAIAVRDMADGLSGFGWVQISPAGTLVGEYRGSKQSAPHMKKFLREGPADAVNYRAEVKDYADTKIRFHFSHFKILDRRRETCFEEPPHACASDQVRTDVGDHDEL